MNKDSLVIFKYPNYYGLWFLNHGFIQVDTGPSTWNVAQYGARPDNKFHIVLSYEVAQCRYLYVKEEDPS